MAALKEATLGSRGKIEPLKPWSKARIATRQWSRSSSRTVEGRRSSYTIGTYRLGIEDFTSWAAMTGRRVEELRRREVEAYIGPLPLASGASNSARVSAAFPAALKPICWLVGRGGLLEG